MNPWKMFHSNSVDSPLIASKSVVSLGSDFCNSVLPSFVGFKMLNFAEAQHRIREDIDFCVLKIDDYFVMNQ